MEAGVTIVLVWVCVPPPQLALQAPYALQGETTQSTGAKTAVATCTGEPLMPPNEATTAVKLPVEVVRVHEV